MRKHVPTIALLLTDPHAVVDRQSFFKRSLLRIQWSLGGTPVLISTKLLKADPERLFEQLASRIGK
jgi:hypothetical protein